MNFASAKAERDAAFTELTMTNGNLSTQLRRQEYQVRDLQAKLFNLKVAAEMQPVDMKTKKTGQPYSR